MVHEADRLSRDVSAVHKIFFFPLTCICLVLDSLSKAKEVSVHFSDTLAC